MEKSDGSKQIKMIDYYTRPLRHIHLDYHKKYGRYFRYPHSIRNRYWQLIIPAIYDYDKATEYLECYLSVVEAEMKSKVEQLSIAFCLHLYRRLFPGPIGLDDHSTTIGLTRTILEAAIQKYGKMELCNKISYSAEIDIGKVFNGLLLSSEFEEERDYIKKYPQLVITNFNTEDLEEFYNLERLAHEIWKTTANLRAVGKGALLQVCEPPDCFFDVRSIELDTLIKNYDSRIGKGGFSVSRTGATFPDKSTKTYDGIISLPTYNITNIRGEDLNDYLYQTYGTKIPDDFIPNFVWIPFNLRGFREAHLPFTQAFYDNYKVSLDSVLLIVGALAERVFYAWHSYGLDVYLRYHQRAYEGPCGYDFILNEINRFIPIACKLIGINKTHINSEDIKDAINFWTLETTNRLQIELKYPERHYIFLPIRPNTYFIDYAWILQSLYDLFKDIWVSDQNFKGKALENTIQREAPVLPTKPCKNRLGDKRQIDYSISRGSYLFIVECRARGQRLSYEQGKRESIDHRIKKVIGPALDDIDEKALWLAKHPVGNNYDITSFTHILPLAVTPFIEFIPSQDKRYWFTNNVPRVLTIAEFEKVLEEDISIEKIFNTVKISGSVPSSGVNCHR